MKKIIVIIFLFTVSFFAYGLARDFIRGKTISAAEVKKRWGSTKLDIEEFKKGSYDKKSAMAYSIMTNKSLIGKSYEEIRKMFGPNDGYYRTESLPAYIVYEAKSPAEDTWQLVFLIDQDDVLREIIMHRNCCER